MQTARRTFYNQIFRKPLSPLPPPLRVLAFASQPTLIQSIKSPAPLLIYADATRKTRWQGEGRENAVIPEWTDGPDRQRSWGNTPLTQPCATVPLPLPSPGGKRGSENPIFLWDRGRGGQDNFFPHFLFSAYVFPPPPPLPPKMNELEKLSRSFCLKVSIRGGGSVHMPKKMLQRQTSISPLFFRLLNFLTPLSFPPPSPLSSPPRKRSFIINHAIIPSGT